MKYICGYGVDVASLTFIDNVEHELLKIFPEQLRKFFRQALKETNAELELADDMSPEDFICEFAEGYENCENSHFGLEGLLCDIINETEFPDAKDPVVTISGDYIYVPPRIPEDEADRNSLPTKKQIRELFDRYLAPYVTEPIYVEDVDYWGNT